MAFAWGSAGQGAADAQTALQDRTIKDLQIQIQRDALKQSLKQQADEQLGERWWEGAGNLSQFLQGGSATGAQQQQPPTIPPPPGQASTPQTAMPPQQQPGQPPQIQMPPPGAMARAPAPQGAMPGQIPGMPQPQQLPPGMPGQMPGAQPQQPPQTPAPMSAGSTPGAGPRAPQINGQPPPGAIAPYMMPTAMPGSGGGVGAGGGAPRIGGASAQAVATDKGPPVAQPTGEPGAPQSWDIPALLSSMQKSGVPFSAAMGMLSKMQGAFSPEQKAQMNWANMQYKLAELDLKNRKESDAERTSDLKRINLQLYSDRIKAQTAEIGARAQLEQEKIREGKVKVGAGAGGVQVPGTGLTADAVEMDAYNRLFFNKYPPGYQKDNKLRIQVDNAASKIAKDAGLTMSEAATLPAEKRADMVSLNNMTKWYDGVKKSSLAVETNIDIMRKYASEVDLTGIQDINAAKVAIEKKFGSVAAQNYENAAMEVMNEYARVMSGPTSNAQLAEGASHRAQQILNTSFTPEQLDGAKETMTQIMTGQLKATEDTIEDRRSNLKSLKPSSNLGRASAPGSGESRTPPVGSNPANAKGWKRMVDKDGNWAYVSPDKTQAEEIH